MSLFFLVVLAVWALMHAYVGWRLASLPPLADVAGRRWLVAALVLGFAAYPAGRILFNQGFTELGRVIEYGGAVWMGFLVILIPALAVADVLTLFGLVMKPWLTAIRGTAVAAAFVLAVAAWVGGQVRPRTVELEVELPGLPAAADGLVVAQLTDLHLGSLTGPRRLQRVIDQIDAMEPDVLAVTGDLVDADAGAVERMIPLLARLADRREVYAVLGNHEYYAGAERSRALMLDAGFVVLDNTARELGPGLWMAGVADTAGGRQTGGLEGDLDSALADVSEGAAVVLLQHTPGGEEQAAASGVDLMLNGHTHGAQIWPAHYLVRLQFPHLAGVRQVDGMTQVVCRGAGTWGPPMRLFAPSEIYRITLRAPGDR